MNSKFSKPQPKPKFPGTFTIKIPNFSQLAHKDNKKLKLMDRFPFTIKNSEGISIPWVLYFKADVSYRLPEEVNTRTSPRWLEACLEPNWNSHIVQMMYNPEELNGWCDAVFHYGPKARENKHFSNAKWNPEFKKIMLWFPYSITKPKPGEFAVPERGDPANAERDTLKIILCLSIDTVGASAGAKTAEAAVASSNLARTPNAGVATSNRAKTPKAVTFATSDETRSDECPPSKSDVNNNTTNTRKIDFDRWMIGFDSFEASKD